MFNPWEWIKSKFAMAPPPPMTDEQRVKTYVLTDICPDCGGKGFYEGPSGGMSQNIICMNATCGSRFNTTGPLGLVERISSPSPLAASAHDKAKNLENRP